MKPSEQTIQQVERFVRKVADKFPATPEPTLLTDIHVVASPESGELRAMTDDGAEVTRCVVEAWIDCKDEDFYPAVAAVLRAQLRRLDTVAGRMGLLRPYSFVLEDDDHEAMGELYVADDDTVIIGGDLMSGMDDDLDQFLSHLMQEH